MKKLSGMIVAIALLFVGWSSYVASAITWDFGEHGNNTVLPNVQQFDTGGFFLSARGFTAGDVPRALYSKNLGGNEIGLGISGLVDEEISGGSFIQLNMDGLRALLTNFKFSMNSVDNNEGWVVYGSQDATPFLFTQLAHSTGLGDESVHTLADGYDNYNFFFATSGFGGSTGDSNVLLHSFSAEIATTPLPSAVLMFGSALGGFVLVTRKRKRKVQALALVNSATA